MNLHPKSPYSPKLSPMKKDVFGSITNFSDDSPTFSPYSSRSKYSRLASSVGHSSFQATSEKTPDLLRSLEGSSENTKIVQQFREKQFLSKTIGDEITAAIIERDQLKDAISEARRRLSLTRSKSEIEATEYLLETRSSNESLINVQADLRSRVEREKALSLSLQRGIEAQREKQVEIHLDIRHIETSTHAIVQRLEIFQRDLKMYEDRCKQLEKRISIIPDYFRKPQKKLESRLESLESEIVSQKRASSLSSSKIQALQEYLQLILHINGDLCTTVAAREDAREKINTLSKRYVSGRHGFDVGNSASSSRQNNMEKLIAANTSLLASFSSQRSSKISSNATPISAYLKNISFLLPNKSALKKNVKKSVTDFTHVTESLKNVKKKSSQQQSKRRSKITRGSTSSKESTTSSVVSAGESTRREERAVSVYNKSLMESASRQAATAAAAAAAAVAQVAVANLAYASPKNRSSSPSPLVRRAFIPSSNTTKSGQGNEFNIIASVSKAAKAATRLNATLASKVKSLVGTRDSELFEGVRKVDFVDMLDHLTTVKRMTSRTP